MPQTSQLQMAAAGSALPLGATGQVVKVHQTVTRCKSAMQSVHAVQCAQATVWFQRSQYHNVLASTQIHKMQTTKHIYHEGEYHGNGLHTAPNHPN